MSLQKVLKMSLSLQEKDANGKTVQDSSDSLDRERDPKDYEFLKEVFNQKSEAQILKEFAEIIEDNELPIENRMAAFDQLEMMVENCDVAGLITKLDLWKTINAQLDSNEERLQVMAASVIGVAVQNHESVQNEFLETGGLEKLLKLLNVYEQLTSKLLFKILFAVRSSMRHNLNGVSVFDKHEGSWESLFTLCCACGQKGPSWKKVSLRSILIIDDMLLEALDDIEIAKAISNIAIIAIEKNPQFIESLYSLLENDSIIENEDITIALCSVTEKISWKNRLLLKPSIIFGLRDEVIPKIVKTHPELEDTTAVLRNSILFDSVEVSKESILRGEMVIILDDESRENEGDLTIAAEFATTENIAFFVRYTSGMICVPAHPEILEKLHLPVMVPKNEDVRETNYTITCDYKEGTTTGISAADRALTIRKIADPNSKPGDFTRPGHVLPLRPKPKGLADRKGHTEASLALCDIAKTRPAAAIGELVNDDGSMKRLDDCILFAYEHKLRLISVGSLCAYKNYI